MTAAPGAVTGGETCKSDFPVLSGVLPPFLLSLLPPSYSTSCVLTLVSTGQGASGITAFPGLPAEMLSGI